MKKPASYLSLFITFILLSSIELGVATQAQAGVLTRGSTSSGISVSKPRSRDRSVRKSTSALSATNPQLQYRGESYTDTYARLQRANYKYEQKYFRWEKKKYQFEQRAYRKEQKAKDEQARLEKKEAQHKNRLAKSHAATPSGEAQPADEGVSIDPRAWFSKKIAHQEEGGLLSLGGAGKDAQDSDSSGKEVSAGKTPQKIGFWGHMKRAIFGI